MSARARPWHRSHTFRHAEFPPWRFAAERRATVSVGLPARDEERTIGPILKALMPLLELGAIDQIVVVDDSRDVTPGDEDPQLLGAAPVERPPPATRWAAA